MAVIKYTDETYEDIIKKNKLVLFDFFATWCAPCSALSPTLDSISEKMKDQLVIAKHDIDEDPNFATLSSVRGVPSLYLYKDGKLVSQKVGTHLESNLISWIKEYL